MSHKPDDQYIQALKSDLRQAISPAKRDLLRALKQLENLEEALEAFGTNDAEGNLRYTDDEEHAQWLNRVISVLADTRERSDQAIRDLVVYAFEDDRGTARPHVLAKSAKVGPPKVYRWRDAGTVNFGMPEGAPEHPREL